MDLRQTGAHFSRNCKESNDADLVIVSGLSATASMIGLRTVLINELVRDSGSFSQSRRLESTSGVEIVAGSLM